MLFLAIYVFHRFFTTSLLHSYLSRRRMLGCFRRNFQMGNCLVTSIQVDSSNIDLTSAPSIQSNNQNVLTHSLKAFSFDGLKTATGRFRHHIDEGGYELIFKGWIDEQTLSPSTPETGMVVAVKRLEPKGFPGHNESLTKLNDLNQLHHPNLLKLIGYCLDDEQLMIVYEFMPNGSLANYLLGRDIQPLSWEIRMKVAIDVAKGLSFLHDAKPQVIYRYLNITNILLDAEFNAKVSAYVSTQVMDIHGDTIVGDYAVLASYVAPESVDTGYVSAKSDVYSFGVLLLVLLTGRPALKKTVCGDQVLVSWVNECRRKLLQIMDVRLKGQYPQEAALAIATLALQCTIRTPSSRPNLSEVLQKLQEAVKPPKRK